MTVYRFRAQAVTPIHVGSGAEIDPGEFLLRDGQLLHFNPSAVVSDLDDEDRRRFMALANRADLKELQAFFRSHCDPGRHGRGWIDASEAFQVEFARKANNPDNRFQVKLMPRNPHTGAVYLPGSGIKGAIRTAVVNEFTNILPTGEAVRQEYWQAVRTEEEKMQSRDPGMPPAKLRQKVADKQGRILEEAALNRRFSKTERDVFRLIEVADIELPADSTRIDRIYNWNPKKPDSQGIQIWGERLKSRADGEAPEFIVSLHIDERAMRHEAVARQLGRQVDIETIAGACNGFYWGRMVAERDKFFKTPEGKSTQTQLAIYRALTHVFDKNPQGQPLAKSLSWPNILLRVGRFSQFESLSVDNLRLGHRPQPKLRGTDAEWIGDMGATRNLCDMGREKPHLPFGWLLLTLEDHTGKK
jgi:CRISPR-associated protein Csm5